MAGETDKDTKHFEVHSLGDLGLAGCTHHAHMALV